MRAMPFRTASDAAVEFSEPRLRVGDVMIYAGDPAPTWDYLASASVYGGVKVHANELLRSTGLTDLAAVSAILQVDCHATGFRQLVAVPVLQTVGHAVSLHMDIEPHAVAGEIEIHYGLVLERGCEQQQNMAPFRRGSRVYTLARTHKFLLEGDAAGFPTEAFDFEPTGYPDGAPWHLNFRAESLGDPFMGAVRLFVNTKHPASAELLSGASSISRSVLFHGILEQLLVTAADRGSRDIEGWDDDLLVSHEEGSVGAVLGNLTSTYLGMSLAAAVTALRDDRDRVLTKLRATAGLLDGGER